MNDRELLKYWNDIPIGAKNAVSYEELSVKWHRTYRGVRKILELLGTADTCDDYILIRSSHGRGFFRTKDRRLIHRYRKEIINRANNVLKPLNKIYKVQARIVGDGSKPSRICERTARASTASVDEALNDTFMCDKM